MQQSKKRTCTMKLPDILTWPWFLRQCRRRWPDSPAPPENGCWTEAVQWLTKHQHLMEGRTLLLKATGDRALALYCAARPGLITERGEALRDLLTHAPGNRASALYFAARDGLITERGNALRDLLTNAPGDRAWALYFAARERLI